MCCEHGAVVNRVTFAVVGRDPPLRDERVKRGVELALFPVQAVQDLHIVHAVQHRPWHVEKLGQLHHSVQDVLRARGHVGASLTRLANPPFWPPKKIFFPPPSH